MVNNVLDEHPDSRMYDGQSIHAKDEEAMHVKTGTPE